MNHGTSTSVIVGCLCLICLGAVVHSVVMSYRNMPFNDETQVYIARYGTLS